MEMKDRLLEFIAYLGVSNYAFEKAVGLSNGYVRSLNGAIGADKLLDICRAYPQLSRDWLLTGVGDMVVHKVWQDGSYIRNGEIYVILTNDGQRMIKRLTYVSTDEDGDKHYICRSDNPDQDKYAPFEVLGSSIRQLSIVKAILSRIE